MSHNRIIILGVGNILLKDEGIGVHVVLELQKQKLPSNVEVIDAGTASLNILACLNNTKKLIIIDAVKGRRNPGMIYRIYPNDLENLEDKDSLSLHQIDVMQSLRIIAKTSGLPDEVVIIGIEPENIEWGTELSNKLKSKIPQVVSRVLKEIDITNNTAN